MSVGQFTLKTWFAYMEELAQGNQLLLHSPTNRHFARKSFEEMLAAKFNDLQYPAMLVDSYEAEGIDNKSNNLLVRRVVAFTIVKKYEAGNYSERLDFETDCETIALQVLSRMYYDRLPNTANGRMKSQVFAAVDLHAWRLDIVSDIFSASMYAAVRVEIPVVNADDRLKFDPAAWDPDSTPPPSIPTTPPLCPVLRVCDNPEEGQHLTYEGGEAVWSDMPNGNVIAGGLFSWDPVLGLMYTRSGILYQVQLNQQ